MPRTGCVNTAFSWYMCLPVHSLDSATTYTFPEFHGDLVARNSTGTVSIELSEDGNYQMLLSVKEIIADSPSGPVSDSTCSGRATRYVVIPEFGMLAAEVPAVSTARINGFARKA